MCINPFATKVTISCYTRAKISVISSVKSVIGSCRRWMGCILEIIDLISAGENTLREIYTFVGKRFANNYKSLSYKSED